MKKLFTTSFLLQLFASVAFAQLKLAEVGTITGHSTMKVSQQLMQFDNYELYVGSSNINNFRLGVFATFKRSKDDALFLRPELSLVQHGIWMSTKHIVKPDYNPAGTVQIGGPNAYHRLEFAPLLVGKFKFLHVQAGPSVWYRFAEPKERNEFIPLYTVLATAEDALRSWVGGYKIGAGISFWRLNFDVNYGQNITRITDKTLLYSGSRYWFFNPAIKALTYDISFIVFRNKSKNK